MSELGAHAREGLKWPSNGLSEVPFWLYTDPEQYALEQQRIWKGPVWSLLCLAAELPKPGDWLATTIGEVAVIVARDEEGNINAFVNRCAHRGNLLCLENRGNSQRLACVYHGWTYDLKGRLTSVAFEHGVKGKGGMPPEFRKDEHNLERLKIAEFSGLVFGSFRADAPDIESYLGSSIAAGIRRVLNRPVRILGRSTQIMPNNWKLYAENTKDTYHASILHLFLTTFRINRLSAEGGIEMSESGANHISWSRLDYAQEDADYRAAQLRSDSSYRLADRSVIESVDEYGDGISLQILSVFPSLVLQQIRNTIAVRVIRPRGVDKTELDWIHLGFADDGDSMTERRLRQGNLVGPAGYISMEDGCIGGFVQRAVRFNDADSGIVMMGGYDAQPQPFRASEAAIRGFWNTYRGLMGE
jgi:phenylpropionate dioxygenase-like ring-hydroxylating dioxygenase large terminal subunit